MPKPTIIPAAPGFSIVGFTMNPDGTPLALTFTPIIAWRFDAPDFYADPVIPPEAYWDDDHGIGFPDGQITVDQCAFAAGTPPEVVLAALVVVQERRLRIDKIAMGLKTV